MATTTKKSGWVYRVTNGSKSHPAGYIGTYGTRAEAEEVRAKKCRMGGYITRESSR